MLSEKFNNFGFMSFLRILITLDFLKGPTVIPDCCSLLHLANVYKSEKKNRTRSTLPSHTLRVGAKFIGLHQGQPEGGLRVFGRKEMTGQTLFLKEKMTGQTLFWAKK